MKLHIQLSPELDSETTKRMFGNGLTPDPIAYGFNNAEKFGFELSFSKSWTNNSAYHVIRRAIIRALCFDVFHAAANWRQISQADIIWTMTDVEYLGVLCVLKLLRNRNTFVICNNVWLWDRLERRSSLFVWVVEKILDRADVITFHSDAHRIKASKSYKRKRLHTLAFGISDQAFKLRAPQLRPGQAPIRIFSPGNDRTRDWKSLYDAFANKPGFEVTIVCDRLPDSYFQMARNFVRVKSPKIEEFIDLYIASDVVVVSMKPNSYSGITVALEAVAMGVPVVASDTGGIRTYFDDDEVTYVASGDVDGLSRAVQCLSYQKRYEQAVRAQKRFIDRSYVCSRMIDDYYNLCQEFLQSQAIRS